MNKKYQISKPALPFPSPWAGSNMLVEVTHFQSPGAVYTFW